MKEKAYWVSEVNRYIKHMFASDFMLGRIAIKGEVSNCKYHSSGHIYFTLKDSTSQIACVMFSAQRKGLKFQLEEGQSVVVYGNVTVYDRDGKYQIYAREIQLDGAGLLFEKYLKLKNELEEEGLFSQIYKQPIPKYAKRVGIVTAITGAAIQDIMNISKRRNPYIQLYLYPAQVQGQGASRTIVEGIQVLDQMGLDVLIVGRGGGSIEDLWAFNEECVARAIFECNTPVISAVGHETDVTISDFVADLRAPTPSAAAELAVADIREVFRRLDELQNMLQDELQEKVIRYRNKCQQLQLQLETKNPRNQIQQNRQRVLNYEDKLEQFMKNKLEGTKYELALYAQRLEGISPLRKLSSGYAFLTDQNGNTVKSVDKVSVGEELLVSVTDGEIFTKVEQIRKITRT